MVGLCEVSGEALAASDSSSDVCDSCVDLADSVSYSAECAGSDDSVTVEGSDLCSDSVSAGGYVADSDSGCGYCGGVGSDCSASGS